MKIFISHNQILTQFLEEKNRKKNAQTDDEGMGDTFQTVNTITEIQESDTDREIDKVLKSKRVFD